MYVLCSLNYIYINIYIYVCVCVCVYDNCISSPDILTYFIIEKHANKRRENSLSFLPKNLIKDKPQYQIPNVQYLKKQVNI